jgi:hypothetical protein
LTDSPAIEPIATIEILKIELLYEISAELFLYPPVVPNGTFGIHLFDCYILVRCTLFSQTIQNLLPFIIIFFGFLLHAQQ